MTPKEKAKELFDNYFLLNESSTDKNDVWILLALNKGLSKKCCLITIDKILDELKINYNEQRINFYLEVRQEIKNL
jgi:hypothetical protein